MNGIVIMAKELVTTESTSVIDPAKDKIIEGCLHTMEEAVEKFNGARRTTLEAAIEFGSAAKTVRDRLPHGSFGPWVDKHFGEKSKRPLSVQWIRVCINASEVWEKYKTNEGKKRKLLANYTDVRSIASLLPLWKDGKDPLDAPPPKSEAIDVEAREVGGDGGQTIDPVTQPPARQRIVLNPDALQAFPEVVKKEKELDKTEEKLEKWEAKLKAREEALDAREAALKERETALKAGEAALKKAQKALSKGSKKVAEEIPEESTDDASSDVDVEALVASATGGSPGDVDRVL